MEHHALAISESDEVTGGFHDGGQPGPFLFEGALLLKLFNPAFKPVVGKSPGGDPTPDSYGHYTQNAEPDGLPYKRQNFEGKHGSGFIP